MGSSSGCPEGCAYDCNINLYIKNDQRGKFGKICSNDQSKVVKESSWTAAGCFDFNRFGGGDITSVRTAAASGKICKFRLADTKSGGGWDTYLYVRNGRSCSYSLDKLKNYGFENNDLSYVKVEQLSEWPFTRNCENSNCCMNGGDVDGTPWIDITNESYKGDKYMKNPFDLSVILGVLLVMICMVLLCFNVRKCLKNKKKKKKIYQVIKQESDTECNYDEEKAVNY
eukprot:UN00799